MERVGKCVGKCIGDSVAVKPMEAADGSCWPCLDFLSSAWAFDEDWVCAEYDSLVTHV